MAHMTQIRFDEGWAQIERAIGRLEEALEHPDGVKGKLFKNAEYMEIYTVCYNMCTQRPPNNHQKALYEHHRSTLEAYLRRVTLPALEEARGEYLLLEMSKRWTNHLIMNKWMAKFFTYLNRYFVEQHNVPPLATAGLHAFKSVVFASVSRRVGEALVELLNKERDGEIVDQSLIQRCIEIYVALGTDLEVYKDHLEPKLSEEARSYCAGKALEWLAVDNTSDYLIKAERFLAQEHARLTMYLPGNSAAGVMSVVEQELLARHVPTLLEREGTGFKFMLRNDKQEDMKRLYSLFSRVSGGLRGMATLAQQYFVEQGMAIVRKREAVVASGSKESTSDGSFVRALLQLHEVSKQLVDVTFKMNSLFQKAMKEAFESFINKEVACKYSNAEMVSFFCDQVLKAGGERLSEDQIDELLDRVVQLFTYIADKDTFANIYRTQLAKRLLNQRSASNDAERSMILKLKLRCGAQFTGKMEGMLVDLTVGSDHQRDFQAQLTEWAEKPGMEFSVQVLTTGFWPSYKQVDLALPSDMVACQALFKRYYDTKTSHRKLHWVHTLGQATMRASFPKGVKDLQVTTLQCVCLLLFNAAPQLSFSDIRAAMNVDEEVCKRIVHSLSCGKYKVLVKTPSSRTISTKDSFAFNAKFGCGFRKIRIPMAALEDSHNPKKLEQDRSIAIEAAVVRTMKTRKRMTHQELVTQVLQQLHFFRPNPKVIKRRIEHLIEREYLERDESQPNVYHYLA